MKTCECVRLCLSLCVSFFFTYCVCLSVQLFNKIK